MKKPQANPIQIGKIRKSARSRVVKIELSTDPQRAVLQTASTLYNFSESDFDVVQAAGGNGMKMAADSNVWHQTG